MAPRGQNAIGWLYLAMALGTVVWAAAMDEWLIAANAAFLWVIVLGLTRKLQQLEVAVRRQTEELAAHVAAHEVSRPDRRRTNPWLAASRGQH